MTKDEVLSFTSANNVDKNSSVIFTVIENDKEVIYNGRFEFNFNGSLAITDEKVGIRVQMIKGAADTPYAGGLLLKNLLKVIIK